MRTKTGQPLPWKVTLQEYYSRDEWQLYDRKADPLELINVAEKPLYQHILQSLKSELLTWQNTTSDPWLCSPHAVLENSGNHKFEPFCLKLNN